MSFGVCLGSVAPFYNLILSVVALLFFLRLFKVSTIKPWVFLFCAFLIYVVEELLTIVRQHGIIPIPRLWNGFFEMAIISLFIYVLLSEMERLSDKRSEKRSGKRRGKHGSRKKL